MFENITPEHSAALDVIVRARHSVRAFSPIPPRKEDIEAIIQAGLLAPFGALAVAGKPDFRKVFVIRNSWGTVPCMNRTGETGNCTTIISPSF